MEADAEVTAQQALERLLSDLPVAAIVTDESGLVEFINERAMSLFGRERHELIGEPLNFAVRVGSTTEIEVWRASNRTVAKIRVAPIDWRGGRARLAILNDITVQHRLAEQLLQAQKMEAIGHLAGGIAHDFSNLLTAILSFTAGVRSQLDPEDPRRADLNEVMHAGEQARLLVARLLSLTRRQAVRMELLDINQEVVRFCKIMRRTLPEDIDLSVLPSSEPALVHGDAAQFDQVLMNLIVNAKDAMPQGGRLTLSLRNVSLDFTQSGLKTGEYVALRVSDTGEGIAPEHMGQIFEPLFTTKAAAQGSGLGLAICRSIIAQSNGAITVESQPGSGTTFLILLPRSTSPEGQLDAPQREAVLPNGSETILVVDDNPHVLRSMASILTSQGFRVLSAAGGEEALRLMSRRGGTLDLAILDYVMPHMSGVVLADRLHTLWPSLRVLFMSGYTIDLSHGFPSKNYLVKPVLPAELVRAVREALDEQPQDPR